MVIRRESSRDVEQVAAVTTAAFSTPEVPQPVETRLLDELRASDAWLPALSLVAVSDDDRPVGHVVCTRARIGSAPALGLGPLSVLPERQGEGVGSALVHAVLAAADALDEPAVVLLGAPAFYGRFGFRLAAEYGIAPPQPGWAPHFQARTLHAWTPALCGSFAYAEPFEHVG
jgi:putative acetyltransferase